MTARQRVGRVVVAVAAAAVTAGCAPLKVFSFPERGVDFNLYRSYAWAPAEAAATGDPRLDNNPFFRDYIRRAVDRELAARGIEKVESAPDLLLHYHASFDQTVYPGELDWHSSAGSARPPDVYDAGTIVIDFLDAGTRRLIWRGWAEGSVNAVIDNQAWMEERIDESVARVLATLPDEFRRRG